jgi:DNA-binding CsgD family transcriptional regulator
VLKALGEPRDLLSTLFKSSTVGVAICDRQFRFRAINDALASMNGLPASEHLGKTLRSVLGSAAAKIQPAFELVFATGQPLSNYEVTAELPAREREVAALLAKGKTNKEIAKLLVISSRTVESHRARIMLKLDLDSLSDLVRYAVRTDLIRL